jgi:ADP-heptose:LPS heptosyltransferase
MKANAVRRILLIVDYCHTGESLHAARHLAAVRHHFPDAWITLLANSGTRDALAVPGVFDQVVISHLYYGRPLARFGARIGKAWEFLRLLVRLGFKYDLVVCFYWGTGVLRLLGYLTCRGERAGHASVRTRLLTIRLPAFERFERTYAEQHRELLSAIGIPIEERAGPAITVADREVSAIDRFVSSHGIQAADRIAVLHPGSDWACQQWRPDRWASLADSLHDRYMLRTIFTGTVAEIGQIQLIRRAMRTPSASLAGEATLSGVAELLRRSALCITVDSAVYDLTQAVGTPAVVLAGPTRPQLSVLNKTRPIVVNRMTPARAHQINQCRGVHFIDGGCLNYSCPFAGLREIDVSDVLAEVDRLLTVRHPTAAVEVDIRRAFNG